MADLTTSQKRMTTARERKRRRDLGPPLAQDDATLAAISTVGTTDLAHVEAFVRDAAGQKGVDMLKATRA